MVTQPPSRRKANSGGAGLPAPACDRQASVDRPALTKDSDGRTTSINAKGENWKRGWEEFILSASEENLRVAVLRLAALAQDTPAGRREWRRGWARLRQGYGSPGNYSTQQR